MVVSGIGSVSPSRCCVPSTRTFTSPCSPAAILGTTQSPPLKISEHSTGYERFLFPATHGVPLQGQGRYKDAVCIGTIRVSYLNSL